MVALTFPCDPDSGTIGPVTVRSRIRVAGGEPVVLKDKIETTVDAGSGWEGLVTTSGHQLMDGRRAARFEAAISDGLSLAKFAELVIPRKPVRIRVTLSPDIQAPLPGVPVPVQAPVPPQTRVVSIAIPSIQPGVIDLEPFSLAGGDPSHPRGGIRARVRLPSFVRPSDAEIRAVQESITFVETGGKSAIEVVREYCDGDDAKVREYAALASREAMDDAVVMVEVTAIVCGMTIRASGQLSFAVRRTFQPYIVPQTLSVTPSTSATFTALVREVLPDGREVDVPDATVSVSVPGSSAEYLAIQPATATGVLPAHVTQLKAVPPGTVSCPVVFQVGKDHCEEMVNVTLGQKTGPLEVEFVPPDKTVLNPFLPGDSVTIRARVNQGNADISFARGPMSRWLDDPSVAVPSGDGWTAVRVEASPPDPGSRTMPPESEPVIVTASIAGTVVAEQSVQVGLITPPLLDATPSEVRILAGNDKGATVVLALNGDSRGTWRFELEEEGETSRCLSVSEPITDGLTAKFQVTSTGDKTPATNEVGPSHWQSVFTLHSRASDGKTEVEGPDVKVIVLREGLFVEKIFAVDERNQYKTNERMTVLPIRVDLPSDDRKRVARVKLVAMVWNGTDLEQDQEAVRGEHLTWDPPVCTAEDCRVWDGIFSVLKAHLVATDDDEVARTPYSDLAGTWGVSLDKVIPGHGEKLQGEVTVHGDAGSVTIPLVLRLGELPDTETLAIERERARCIRMIQGCIPGPRRQDLLDHLENLPCKGARDYQIIARLIYDTAWKIWAEDQKDYQYWENGWGSYLLAGAEYTKKAGDLCFNLLVGYATSALGPVFSYGASTMATEFKDQSLEFYSYYVAHSDTKDFQTCIIDFVNERFTEFLTTLATGAVDTVILRGIDIRNPKTYTRLAWLWLWKIEMNYARDPEAGLFNAMVAAGKEVAMAASMMLLQEFVNTHGNSDVRNLYNSIQKKGLLGPGHAGVEEETGGKKKIEEKTPGEPDAKKGDGKKSGTRENYNEHIESMKKKSQQDADNAIKNAKDSVNQNEKEAFLRGREIGREKVERLRSATEDLQRNPRDSEARKRYADACEEVQQDKHAMHELNDIDPNKPNKVRENFNEYWKGQYEKVDRRAKQKIADELNRDLKPGERAYTADDIEVVGVTNTPPKSAAEDSVKSTYDRDITYRNRRTGEDIPTRISEPVYNNEFYKQRHGGKEPPSPEEAKKFAEECDQTVTDRFHPDAYGGGKVDIGPATDPIQKGKPFKDVGASAKTMEGKVTEWYNRARKASTSETAEACKEEGMRQLTKQFKNQIEGRVDKLNEIMGYPDPPIAEVPPKIRAAVDVMNRVGKRGPDGEVFTVADAEAALKNMGTDPQKVVSEMSGVLESLQKHIPTEARNAVEQHVRDLEAADANPPSRQQRLKSELKKKWKK